MNPVEMEILPNRKAQAVKDCLAGEVTNLHPASILQIHPDTRFFMDKPAASLLK